MILIMRNKILTIAAWIAAHITIVVIAVTAVALSFPAFVYMD